MHPIHFTRGVLAQTRTGQSIKFSASHSLDALKNQRPILLMGGVHGDEPEGVELAKKTQEWLESNSMTAVHPWLVIPCLNPDGYAAEERTNARGVDLNRNFPAKSWSPGFRGYRYFPGMTPGSEVETQTVCQLIQELRPRLVIHCHSWDPCVVCTGEPGLPAATALATASGYELVHSIGYETPGSLSEYGWKDQGIPIICIEEQAGAPLETVWSHFSEGIERIFTKSASTEKVDE